MSRERLRRALLVPALVPILATVLLAQIEEVVETYVDGSVRARYSIDARGRKSGKYARFHRNGKVRLRANYRQNILHGRYETWYRDGGKRLQTSYRAGKLHGRHRSFSPDQRRVVTAHYQDGVRHGALDVTEDGKTLTRQIWKQGQLFELNGHRPFPRPPEELRQKLAQILRAPPKATQDPKLALRAAALRRLQAYRYLCSVPWEEMELDPTLNGLCDAAAEICRRIGRLDHHPPKPSGMDDATYRRGSRGASHSNLSMGSGMVRSVDSYMNDSDPGNIARLGHRRWCLNPAMRKTGFGESGRFSAMWAHDRSGGAGTGQPAIYYPPRGLVPVDFFGARHAFSISVFKGGQARKDDLQVKITPLDDQYLPAGKPLEIDYLNVTQAGAGIPHCLIFRPKGLVVSPGSRYWVEVSYDRGKTRAHEYLVEFVKPIQPDPR